MVTQGSMNLQRLEREGYIVFFIQGPINAMYSPQLREAITTAFQSDIKGVICDLGDVNYMDSSGLATLVEGIQTGEQKEKKFLLTRMHNEWVKHLLEITRLTDLFPHFDSPEQAIDHYENING